MLLPGTGLKARGNERHFWKNLDEHYWIVHFGWLNGQLTNKAAGCAIIFNKKSSLTETLLKWLSLWTA